MSPPTRYNGRLLCGPVLIALLAACTQKTEPPKTTRTQQMTPSGDQTVCIGRFTFSVPADLPDMGRTQSIYTVDVKTEANSPMDSNSFWHARMAKIRSMQPPKDVPTALFRSVDLEPGAPAVWFYASPDLPSELTLEAMRDFGNHRLLLSSSSTADQQSANESLLRNVIQAYRPGSTSGFCVGYGSITSEPSENESTLLTMSDHEPKGVSVRIGTETVGSPDNKSYSSLDEEKRVLRANGGQLLSSSQKPRAVAGLNGVEIKVEASSPGDPSFARYTWHFPGVPDDAYRPSINVVAFGPLTRVAKVAAAYETVLQSLRPVAR